MNLKPLIYFMLGMLSVILGACASKTTDPTPPDQFSPPELPDVDTVVKAHKKKDAEVNAVATEGERRWTDFAPFAVRLRAATAGAPASDIDDLSTSYLLVLASYETREREQAGFIAQLKQQVSQLKNDVINLQNASLKTQQRWLTGAGIGLIALFGASAIITSGKSIGRTWILIPLAVGAFGLAQMLGHRWFLPSMVILIIGTIGAVIWWFIKSKQDGTLEVELQKKSEILKQLVWTIEQHKKNGTVEVQNALKAGPLNMLRDILDLEEKDMIDAIVATTPLTKKGVENAVR